MKRVLAESHAFESRILGEGNEAMPVCEHRVSTVLEMIGGGLDDHSVHWMRCLECPAHFVVTSFASRPDADIRPMTLAEITRYSQENR